MFFSSSEQLIHVLFFDNPFNFSIYSCIMVQMFFLSLLYVSLVQCALLPLSGTIATLCKFFRDKNIFFKSANSNMENFFSKRFEDLRRCPLKKSIYSWKLKLEKTSFERYQNGLPHFEKSTIFIEFVMSCCFQLGCVCGIFLC